MIVRARVCVCLSYTFLLFAENATVRLRNEMQIQILPSFSFYRSRVSPPLG